MIEVIYEPTNQKCWINVEYIIDIFPHGEDYIAYTVDFERGGYIINKETFESWMEDEEE